MTSKYFLRKALRTNPNSEQFYLDQDITESPDDVQKYINWLHERACFYENTIQEKNQIIEAKHKEIKRLNLCLLKRFFTIRNLKKLLNSSDDFFEGIEKDFPGTLEKGREMLKYISKRNETEEAFDEMVKINQETGQYNV